MIVFNTKSLYYSLEDIIGLQDCFDSFIMGCQQLAQTIPTLKTLRITQETVLGIQRCSVTSKNNSTIYGARGELVAFQRNPCTSSCDLITRNIDFLISDHLELHQFMLASQNIVPETSDLVT
jgi:hypothetical protein